MKTASEPLAGVSQLLRLEVTDSTQTVAKFLAQQGAAEGTLVWADRQTAGRGRLERRWDSRPGGLYVSLILRPGVAPKKLAGLSLTAAEACAKALASLADVETRVKRPNDVLAFRNGAGGKVCGILIEASGGLKRVDWTVVGIGVNVNNRPALPGSTSLGALTGRRWDTEKVLRAVLRQFHARYTRFLRLTPGSN